ncbi:hypothetical protein AB0O18_01870 [Streptomyces sp. NPDC093224]|uniref:hypothetical protein n=1 Tax=Streptomyces sp. NPDC093224 TaxID=3155198 RepID=UPI00344943F3
MITARSSYGAPRIRRRRIAATLLWPVLLLLGLLPVHGAAGEGGAHHSGAAAAVRAALQPAVAHAAEPRASDADSSSHPAPHCTPGRPDLAAAPASGPQTLIRRTAPALPTAVSAAPRPGPPVPGAPPCSAPGVLRI